MYRYPQRYLNLIIQNKDITIPLNQPHNKIHDKFFLLIRH